MTNIEISLAIFTALVLIIVIPSTQAATYYSIKPGEELCTSIEFGLDGRDEYTLYSEDPGYPGKPWIDNHFTSFIAGPDNIILVPICFSGIGRKIKDNANVRLIVEGPLGNSTIDYGVCIAKYGDVDEIAGPAAGNACDKMADHTDVFTASLIPSDVYANPGETLTFTLALDSSTPVILDIAKGVGDMQIVASQATVDVEDQRVDVGVQMVAPSTPGDYDFSLVVNAQGCSISDCRRDVTGTLHVVAASQEPGDGASLALSPSTMSINGKRRVTYSVYLHNFGPTQLYTISVGIDDALETDFATYEVSVGTGQNAYVPFTVQPLEDESGNYKIEAVAVGEDGTSVSGEAWLTVNEMKADVLITGNDFPYDNTSVPLSTWVSIDPEPGAVIPPTNGGTTDPPVQDPNMFLYAIIGVVIVVIAVLVFYIYKKMKISKDGTSWEDLGA